MENKRKRKISEKGCVTNAVAGGKKADKKKAIGISRRVWARLKKRGVKTGIM